MSSRQKLCTLLLLLTIPLMLALPVFQAGINYQLQRDIRRSYRQITEVFDEARVRSAAVQGDSQFAEGYRREGIASAGLAGQEGGRTHE